MTAVGNPTIDRRQSVRRSLGREVAIAVIERRGRYLICRRQATDPFGGYWEFPGGKREPGESWRDCLRRELREELGVTIRAIRPCGSLRFRYAMSLMLFRIYRCTIAGTPRPLASQTLRWVPFNQFGRYQFPPANQRFIERLWKSSQASRQKSSR